MSCKWTGAGEAWATACGHEWRGELPDPLKYCPYCGEPVEREETSE
jgi:rRNA maturation endonuclease Nob1